MGMTMLLWGQKGLNKGFGVGGRVELSHARRGTRGRHQPGGDLKKRKSEIGKWISIIARGGSIFTV